MVTSSHYLPQAEGTMAQQRATEDGELGGVGGRLGIHCWVTPWGLLAALSALADNDTLAETLLGDSGKSNISSPVNLNELISRGLSYKLTLPSRSALTGGWLCGLSGYSFSSFLWTNTD